MHTFETSKIKIPGWSTNIFNMATRLRFVRTPLFCLGHRMLKRNVTYSQLRLTISRCLSLSCMSCNAKGSKTQGSFEEKKVYDVAIVGGGIMGSSSAYFLANRMSPGVGKICVIERDPTVSKMLWYMIWLIVDQCRETAPIDDRKLSQQVIKCLSFLWAYIVFDFVTFLSKLSIF